MKTKVLIGIVIMVVASACSSSNTCYESMDSLFRMTMHKQVFDPNLERYVEQDFQTTATISGLGVDSILYYRVTSSQFAVPLCKLDTESVFLIEQIRVINEDTIYAEDTLWVEHVNKQEFVSLECGCATTFDVKEIRHSVNMIDSVKIVAGHIDRTNVNNLKIFVRK